MSRIGIATFGLNCLFAIGLAAQDQKSAAPPPPKPGPEHARLKKLEGTWDAVMTTPDGKKSKGVMTYKMECGDLWLFSDYKGEHEGKPFHGKGVDTYDLATKKHVGFWVDNMMTSPMNIESTYDEKTKTSTGIGSCNGPDGKPMKMKMVTKVIDDDHEVFEMYMIGEGGKEMKGAVIEYARRKAGK